MKPPDRRQPLRDRERTRQLILETAFGAVYRHGFQGVSVDDIVEQTSLTKGAFYHHFPTKRDLGYALVDNILEPLTIARWITPLDGYDNPLEGIVALMELHIGQAAPSELRTGCPLNNLVQEMAPIDAGFRKRLQRVLKRWIDGLEPHLRRGRAAGHLRRDVNTRQAAHFIVMLHEGTYGVLKGLNDPRAFAALCAQVKAYLRSLARHPSF